MEKMFEMMLKSMGFNPAELKVNVETAAVVFKDMADRLIRVEQKLDLLLNESSPVVEPVSLSGNNEKH